MPGRLLACPSCARHIRLTETRCPFCAATCPESFASTPDPIPPPRGLTRAGLFRFGALATVGAVSGGMALGGTLTMSCGGDTQSPASGASTDTGMANSTSTETATETHTMSPGMTYTATSSVSAYGLPPDCDGLVSVPDGSVAAPGACSGKEYVFLPLPNVCFGILNCASDLDGGISGDYALCSDGSFSVCTGNPPSGGRWVQVELPDAGDGGERK